MGVVRRKRRSVNEGDPADFPPPRIISVGVSRAGSMLKVEGCVALIVGGVGETC